MLFAAAPLSFSLLEYLHGRVLFVLDSYSCERCECIVELYRPTGLLLFPPLASEAPSFRCHVLLH